MKVIQALPRMNVGGVERGVVDLAKYLKNKDTQNIVISGGGRLVGELRNEKTIHHTMPIYSKSPLSLLLIPRVKKILYDNRADIIHARSRVPAWISFFASRGTETDFITTAHGVYSTKFSSRIMGWGKFVICPSKTVARHMRENFGVPEEKIVIINRWVDLDKFRFTDYTARKNNNVIVSIGRISPAKGYQYLIEGFKKLVRFNPYLTLKIIGPADKSKTKYFSQLQTLVNRFSLNYNVKFVGHKSDIENALVEARLLVAPSIKDESFGRVVVEAFACGVPVVATKIGGFNEIVEDGVNGYLVKPKSANAISDAILKVLNDSEKTSAMTINARKKVEELYTLDKCALEINNVYQKTKSTKRIAVLKISALGDIILIIPTLKMLRESFPDADISLITLKKYSTLFNDCPYVDKVIGVSSEYKKMPNIRQIARKLRCQGLDYIIDLQNNRATHLISFLSFPRQSFGFSRKLGFLLTKRGRFPKKGTIGPLESQERITSFLGLKFKQKELKFWQRAPHNISNLSLGDKPLIGINVSASLRWSTKNWPKESIAKLIETIQKALLSHRVVLLGDKSTVSLAKEIESLCKGKPINLCGKTTLPDLIEVLKKLDVFLTPDTATLHLAQSLGIDTIALFGPTNPKAHTIKDKNLHVICKNLPCSFCYAPKCKTYDCMQQITVSEVFTKIKELIRK
ncbi:MAG: glycosyltransferase [Candidatus Omnitrophica bacterium]|nr:glycosyltransferase [Candidatus Omnitrophota bacterium]